MALPRTVAGTPIQRTAMFVPIGLSIAWLVSACAGPSKPDPVVHDVFQGVEEAERSVGKPRPRGPSAEQPVAVANRKGVTWDRLAASLFERSGREVLEELVLDQMLERELARRNLVITDEAVDREERLLRTALERDAGISGSASGLAIQQLRARRGLGPVRYAALLRRNASLRRLVETEVEVTEEITQFAYRIVHGERVRLRILVTADERSAALARARILEPNLTGSDLLMRFSAVAYEVSTDASRDRGGRIESLSLVDTRYPAPLRHAVSSLEVGQLSPVLAIEGGFAVVLLEAKLPPDGVPYEQVRDSLAESVRTRQERLLMDELARRLLSEASVQVLDPSLNWSWEAQAPAP